MTYELAVLMLSAASIAFFHTLLGPDHYLPFIMMAKSGNWSLPKTTVVTLLCGIGHVLSSIILGVLGIALGIAVSSLESVEAFRGELAAWLLIGFGLLYGLWGIKKALKNQSHTHLHIHEDGTMHTHQHNHESEHLHVHTDSKKNITPWILFTIFLFGPCEPLIPLLMYPAAQNSYGGMIIVTTIFALVTLATMLSMVLLSTYGLNFLPLSKLERYTHALAGGTIFMCGIAIQFLGL